MPSQRVFGWVLSLSVFYHLASLSTSAAQNARLFTLPIEVKSDSAEVEVLPVSVSIDFTALLRPLGVTSPVDERSFRFFRVAENGRASEEPCQYIPVPQPRLKERKALPDTPPGVSYLGEYKAGESLTGLNVAGNLHWVLRKPAKGTARYRLEFAVPQKGTFVQVPFPPQNLRFFDESGRSVPVRSFPNMQIRPQWPLEGKVEILDGSQLVTGYHTGPGLTNEPIPFRRPFLYPLNGPDGISLTEFGKPHDPTGSHAHHYSFWVAHNSVNGKEFWSEKGGVIAHAGFERMEDGPLFCELVQNTRWKDGPRTLLNERRGLTFHKSENNFRLIDVDLQFSPAGGEPVVLGKTSFGFLAARVAQSMTVFDGGGEILNSNGDRNERAVHLKRARWLDQSGPIAPGKWGGIAIFDHPQNPGYPNGWHCRNDGWAGAAFNMDEAYTLQPGKTLRLRYRVLLHSGNATTGEVARRFEEFATKTVVSLGSVSSAQ